MRKAKENPISTPCGPTGATRTHPPLSHITFGLDGHSPRTHDQVRTEVSQECHVAVKQASKGRPKRGKARAPPAPPPGRTNDPPFPSETDGAPLRPHGFAPGPYRFRFLSSRLATPPEPLRCLCRTVGVWINGVSSVGSERTGLRGVKIPS